MVAGSATPPALGDDMHSTNRHRTAHPPKGPAGLAFLPLAALRLVAALTLALSVTAGMAVSPASAAGCYGPSCRGYDPEAMGCSADGRTIHSYRSEYGSLFELRYSSSCGAAWVRVWNANGAEATVWNPGTPSMRYINNSPGGSPY